MSSVMPVESCMPHLKPFDTAQRVDVLVAQAAPPAQRVLRALVEAQTRYQLLPPDQPVIVAVSGGADSVCLLHALHQLAPSWRLALHVAHLDHGLRPDSAADAAFVGNLAHQLGLPFYQQKLTPGTLDDDPQGLEAAARLARYAFLREVAMQLDGSVTIATAHHQDDQAETLLLHLIQGSGLQGLAGMAWVGTVPDNKQPPLRLVRPLLGMSRAELHAYLRAYGLTWREDSSNYDLAQLRNQVRHTVLPQLAALNPNIHATLARTAALLAAEADHAAARDRAALAAWTCESMPSTRIVLDWFPLSQADQATQRGVLRRAMLDLGIDLRAVGLEGIDTLLDLAQAVPSGPHPLSAGWSWTLLNAAYHHAAISSSPAPPGQDLLPRFLLSIHRADALPITIPHPHIAAPRYLPQHMPHPIPRQGTVTHGAWQLHSTTITPAALPADWRDRGQPWRLFVDADAAGDLYLTTFQPGMSIAPLGMHGHHRALGDIFTDRKVPPYLRTGWPVVVSAPAQTKNGHAQAERAQAERAQAEVVWLCGLVVSEHVRVHAQTRHVRHLHWQLETPGS